MLLAANCNFLSKFEVFEHAIIDACYELRSCDWICLFFFNFRRTSAYSKQMLPVIDFILLKYFSQPLESERELFFGHYLKLLFLKVKEVKEAVRGTIKNFLHT